MVMLSIIFPVFSIIMVDVDSPFFKDEIRLVVTSLRKYGDLSPLTSNIPQLQASVIKFSFMEPSLALSQYNGNSQP